MDSCKFVTTKNKKFKPTIRQIYPCKLCKSVFTRRDNLKRHNINVACDTPITQHINKKKLGMWMILFQHLKSMIWNFSHQYCG